jgi:8-oxo-dGTP pyrophosphatase MutT (NUDIX family)
MTTQPASEAIPAATVVIARDGGAAMEILVIERAAGMGFAGGAIAFPGGKVDATDVASVARLPGFAALDPADAASRVAAAREAFEETGILLSTGSPVASDARARLRQDSDRHMLGFADLLSGIGHDLPAGALKPFSRWMPPEGLHKRFDTRFYLATCPIGEAHQADGNEAVLARWATPQALLDQADAGGISILFPTRCNLARLAQFATVKALWADPTPPAFIQPRIEQAADGPVLTIPEGLGYPYTRESLANVRRQ